MISSDAIALIKHFEGCKLKSYKCPAGVWTIGYGHTSGVKDGQTITQAQADHYLAIDIQPIEQQIRSYVTAPLKQHQLDALACFVFNVGIGNFATSTLRKLINAHDYDGAALQFGKWTKADGKDLPGLITRRAAERALFEGKPA